MSRAPAEAQSEAAVVALTRAIRDEDAPARLQDDLHGFLRAHGVEDPDLAPMASLGARRLRAYRALVHNRVRNTLDDFAPRTCDRLGLARVRDDVAAFLAERAIQSPYLRDVPRELVHWAIPRWRADASVPDYIPDLARHELLRLDVKNAPVPEGREDESTGHKLELHRPVRVHSSATVMRYDFAVHELPKARSDRTEPARKDTWLIAFRGADQKTHYIDGKPWVAALVERLIAGQALQPALIGALEATGIALDDDMLGRAAVVLADFMDQGLLLGAELD
jgi:uncharacterized protein